MIAPRVPRYPRAVMSRIARRLSNDSKGASRLLADRGPPATAAARRRAHGHLARDRAGRLGRGPPDGAHRDPAAPGPAAPAGRAELELARVRDARGVLAPQAHARAAPHRADGGPAPAVRFSVRARDRPVRVPLRGER